MKTIPIAEYFENELRILKAFYAYYISGYEKIPKDYPIHMTEPEWTQKYTHWYVNIYMKKTK